MAQKQKNNYHLKYEDLKPWSLLDAQVTRILESPDSHDSSIRSQEKQGRS
jgi:hypothetical protein